MSDFAAAFAAAANKQHMRRSDAQEDEKIKLLVRKATRDELTDGFADNVDGKVDFDPNYYTPGTPSYQRGDRASALKAMEHPSAVGVRSPLTIKQVFETRGEDLPASFAGHENDPFDPKYISAFPTKAKEQPQMSAQDIIDFQRGNPRKDLQVPAPFAGIARQATSPGSQMADADQQAAYEQMMGLPQGAAKNFTRQQISSGFSNVSGQRAAGDRQGKALSQSADLHAQDMDFNKEKDLNTRVQAFRDDYAKTGIPQMLPKFKRLDELTGVLSKEKPNLAKFPGYGTNALRAIPLVGSAAATMASKTYGGEEQGQILQALLNADIRQLSGQAVTKYEEGRVLVTAGMGLGGNEADVARGIRLMYEAMQGADQDVRAGYPAEVPAEYERRGGGGKLGLRPSNPSDLRAQGGKRNAYMDPAIQAAIKNPESMDPATEKAANAKLKQIKDSATGGKKTPAGPKVGDVIDGHRFKGGSPGEQKNWEKVK